MEITATFLVLVPVVLGVVQIIKKVGMPTRYAPVASLILGVLGAFLVTDVTLQQTVLQGIIVGLSASGLWSGTKTTMQ